MHDISKFEAYYIKCMQNLPAHLPEGVLHVDLEFLQKYELLNFSELPEGQGDDALTRYFHVIESTEKITLMNERFVIWIVPSSQESANSTTTLIALRLPEGPKLEMAFTVAGVYNTSRLVLRVLEKLLHEIQENEEELLRLKKAT